MDGPRWPMIAGVVVLIVLVGAGSWALGRSGHATGDRQKTGEASAASVRNVGGVPVGVNHSRAGALAAADNYVALASETALQDPVRYGQLVRAAYAPSYQATALREAQTARATAPEIVADYKSGRRGLAIVAARRLDAYSATTAQATTWRVGVVWSPTAKPFSQWFLTQTSLRWDGARWRVAKTDDLPNAAPSPAMRFRNVASLQTGTFDQELRGMTAPVYGAGG